MKPDTIDAAIALGGYFVPTCYRSKVKAKRNAAYRRPRLHRVISRERWAQSGLADPRAEIGTIYNARFILTP